MIVPDYPYCDGPLPAHIVFGVWATRGAYSDRRTDLITLYASERAAWTHVFQATAHLDTLVKHYGNYDREDFSMGFPDDAPPPELKRFNPYDEWPDEKTVYFVTLEFLNVVPEAVTDMFETVKDAALEAGLWGGEDGGKYITPFDRWKASTQSALPDDIQAPCEFCGHVAHLTLWRAYSNTALRYGCSDCRTQYHRKGSR